MSVNVSRILPIYININIVVINNESNHKLSGVKSKRYYRIKKIFSQSLVGKKKKLFLI